MVFQNQDGYTRVHVTLNVSVSVSMVEVESIEKENVSSLRIEISECRLLSQLRALLVCKLVTLVYVGQA